jgi:hypothetical protein
MRNLTAVVSTDDIHAACRELWRTEVFRASHDDPNGYVFGVIDAYARLPRLFCDLDDPPIEKSHFLAWMGVTPRRDWYDNPAIQDLYYLHEYVHQATMVYDGHLNFDEWCRKVWDNERDASLQSEVFVYFELPELRPQSFAFPIWADRFLADASVRQRFHRDRGAFVDHLTAERERAMCRPTSGDTAERLISSYHRLNLAWVDIWKPHFTQVESALATFEGMASEDRVAAINYLADWHLQQQGPSLCPFEAEAHAFAKVLSGSN